MIKASELRIDVSKLLFVPTQKEITISDGHLMWCYQNNEDFNKGFKPIPLTPELLEKCGFEWDSDKKTHIQKETIEGALLTFYYEDNELDEIQFYSLDGMDYYRHPATFCKYLHQLQNIYYALTNVELNINL